MEKRLSWGRKKAGSNRPGRGRGKLDNKKRGGGGSNNIERERNTASLYKKPSEF